VPVPWFLLSEFDEPSEGGQSREAIPPRSPQMKRCTVMLPEGDAAFGALTPFLQIRINEPLCQGQSDGRLLAGSRTPVSQNSKGVQLNKIINKNKNQGMGE